MRERCKNTSSGFSGVTQGLVSTFGRGLRQPLYLSFQACDISAFSA